MQNLIRVTLIISILLLRVVLSSTQNNPTYTLETGTLDEFIEIIPTIVSQFSTQDAVGILSDEFWLRYADDALLEEVLTVYEALNFGFSAFAFYSPYLDVERWHLYNLNRWMRENPTDLSTIDSFEFADYHVDVMELYVSDINQPDWLLSLHYPTFSHHWLARLNSDSITGYELISLPTAYYEANYSWSQRAGGSPRIPVIEDITGDGLVEFMFTDWMPAPASWTSASFHSYEVISWNEDSLLKILDTDVLDDDRTPWTHLNIDDDIQLEIIQTVNYWDNLGCHRQSITVFDYLNGTYVEGEENSIFADTIYCDLHQAENAYINQEFDTAIIYYEQAREHYATIADINEIKNATPYFMYGLEKLAISYTLTGQIDQAEALIREMNTMPQAEDTIAFALRQIIEDGTDAIEICQTAYSTMEAFKAEDWRANYRGIPHVGTVNEAFYGENSHDGTFSTGCDLSFLIDSLITNNEFSMSLSPVIQIQSLDFSIRSKYSIDLNRDGIDDWLLWINGINNAYLFLSDEHTYTLSIARLGEPSSDRLFHQGMLPSGEIAIAVFSNYRDFGCSENAITSLEPTGVYYSAVWRLNKTHELVQSPIGLICTNQELPNRVSFAEIITRWNIQKFNTDNVISSNELVWNPETLSYVAPVSNVVTTVPIWSIRSDIYFMQDYVTAINHINERLDISEDEQRAELLYYRGLSYQMLGQSDLALGDYANVVTNFSESIWGYLSELQIREVETS